MKISEILKNKGLFSKDIKIRFNNKQILLNDSILETDQDIEFINIIESDEFIFNICKNHIWALRIKIFGLESLIDSNIKNDLTEFLDKYYLLRISKKELLILEK